MGALLLGDCKGATKHVTRLLGLLAQRVQLSEAGLIFGLRTPPYAGDGAK